MPSINTSRSKYVVSFETKAVDSCSRIEQKLCGKHHYQVSRDTLKTGFAGNECLALKSYKVSAYPHIESRSQSRADRNVVDVIRYSSKRISISMDLMNQQVVSILFGTFCRPAVKWEISVYDYIINNM